MKYIIALRARYPEAYVLYARQNFADIASLYLIGDESIPHITLVQFTSDGPMDSVACELLSKEIINAMKTRNMSLPKPDFTGLYLKHDEWEEQRWWWAGYSVARDDFLVELHEMIKIIIETQGKKVLNKSGHLYRPHMTLARIKTTILHLDLDVEIPHSPFDLVLGKADALGQFIEDITMIDKAV